MAEESNIHGKKVFFLFPSAVVQNRIIEEFIQQEFEVYLMSDIQKLYKALNKYPDSIIFANINEGMSEKEWEAWIKSIQSKKPEVSIGIISATDDEALRTKYLSVVQIKGGFTVLKSDLGPAIKQIHDILIALDAKGRRKYLRAITRNETNTTVNMPFNGNFIKGAIFDISVVGFSCSFETDPVMPKNSRIQDIQIKLQTSLLKTEGIVFGSRTEGDTKIYVILFTQRTDPDTKARIRRYIQSNLQDKMDKES